MIFLVNKDLQLVKKEIVLAHVLQDFKVLIVKMNVIMENVIHLVL